MQEQILDRLKSLHTSAVDARNGYDEALQDADGKGLTSLFREMITLHESNAQQLAQVLRRANVEPDQDGSFMSTIHRTIMQVRSLFNGLDESVLPGLIDGETRNSGKYDELLNDVSLPKELETMLAAQREKLQRQIGKMESMKSDMVA